MNHRAPGEGGGGESKWGYAVAGGLALGFAAVIQFAFNGMSPDALDDMPAYLSVPYKAAGTLGLTIPLAVLGVGLIARDVLVNGRRAKAGTARHDEELETGEPIPEEEGKKPVGKIPARGGTFSDRRGAGGGNSGAMVLSSAKYLNKGGPGTFRKGRTNNTTTSE